MQLNLLLLSFFSIRLLPDPVLNIKEYENVNKISIILIFFKINDISLTMSRVHC